VGGKWVLCECSNWSASRRLAGYRRGEATRTGCPARIAGTRVMIADGAGNDRRVVVIM